MPEAESPTAGLLDGALCAVHGTPATFVCARCGTYGCPGCTGPAFDGQLLCASCLARAGEQAMPWERRAELGTLTAFWRTFTRVTFSPTDTFRASPEGGSLLAQLAYGVVAWCLAPAVGTVLYVLFIALALGLAAESGSGSPLHETTGSVMVFACVGVGFGLLMLPVYAVIATFLDAGITHLVLYLTGPVRRPFEATLRAVSYANAPYLLFFVPCIGMFVAFPWMLVSEIIALREVHGVSNGRAALAVLGYRVLVLGAIVFFYAALIGVMVAGLPTER